MRQCTVFLQSGLTIGLAVLFAGAALIGCTTSSETAGRDNLTAYVGSYSAPPADIFRPRVGVPPFQVTGQDVQDMEEVAADQLTTLAQRSDRFRVIERAQLQQLLDEQSLEGIVRSGELAAPANVRGVDYLFFGKVSNFRVKAEETSSGFGIGRVQVPYAGSLGGFDYKNRQSRITVECGVDLRLVDPSTGEILDSMFSEYTRTDSIEAIGVDILGASAESQASLRIDKDSKGKVLRLALDDALRKMLPSLDRRLASLAPEEEAVAAAPKPAAAREATAQDAPEETQSAAETAESDSPAPNFCSACGGKLEAGAKFCGGCGEKVAG